jgi:glucose/arabinose dehydrogenase
VLLADLTRNARIDLEQVPPTAERFRVSIDHCPNCEDTPDVGDPQSPEHTNLACAECDAEMLDLKAAKPRLTHAIPLATRRTVATTFGTRLGRWPASVRYGRSDRAPGSPSRHILQLASGSLVSPNPSDNITQPGVEMSRSLLAALVFSVIGTLWSNPARALPAGFVEQEIPGPWSGAAGIEWGPGGLMYVVERGGKVWIVENGVKQPTPFIDISSEVGGWRDYGLLGFALHPNFAENHYVYLYYVVDHYDLRMCNAARDNATCQPPTYNAATDEYFQPTIGRITRYEANPATNYRTVLPASRRVLVGETIGTGFPILHQSHGTGHLVFGEDGTLLATCGDAGSYNVVDLGSNADTYYVQALAEGIIRPEENIGALRSQFLGSLDGKMIRIDPLTGDGLPSNPFYDAASPRSPQSRTWALGLRNPYRFSRRPGTGSHDPEDGDPGTFYLGDVGWNAAEDLHVIKGPGRNLGWPHFEGLTAHANYSAANVANLYAKNPLFGVAGCAQEYLYFKNLVVQEKQNGVGSWPNPCNAAVQIPDSWTDGAGRTWRYFKFMHTRPRSIGAARPALRAST